MTVHAVLSPLHNSLNAHNSLNFTLSSDVSSQLWGYGLQRGVPVTTGSAPYYGVPRHVLYINVALPETNASNSAIQFSNNHAPDILTYNCIYNAVLLQDCFQYIRSGFGPECSMHVCKASV